MAWSTQPLSSLCTDLHSHLTGDSKAEVGQLAGDTRLARDFVPCCLLVRAVLPPGGSLGAAGGEKRRPSPVPAGKCREGSSTGGSEGHGAEWGAQGGQEECVWGAQGLPEAPIMGELAESRAQARGHHGVVEKGIHIILSEVPR